VGVKFAELYDALDGTTRTSQKETLLQKYFEGAGAREASCALFVLTGQKSKGSASSADMKKSLKQVVDIPDWLFKECYSAVGDLSETISLLVPAGDSVPCLPDLFCVVRRLQRAKSYQKPFILRRFYAEQGRRATYFLNKLLTGGLRVGVSTKTVLKSIAASFGVDEDVLRQRISGEWDPTPGFWETFTSDEAEEELRRKPYPFYLAYNLEDAVDRGDVHDYVFEEKFDGIRAQAVVRDEEMLWSRGGDVVNASFPELMRALREVPRGTVLDGEIIGWKNGSPLPFNELQRRLGRDRPSAKLRGEVPVRFVVYDCLEHEGRDLRSEPYRARRSVLESLRLPDMVTVADQRRFSSWNDAEEVLDTLRSYSVEGFMLKREDGVYKSGRVKGDWWKWKVDPFELDAVLMYGQTGHGKRAGLYTDYTFGVWRGDEVVPIAKAYSGLSNEEIEEVDSWIRGHTVAKYGPVREVERGLVFEIVFQGIFRKESRKSGYVTRFPRIRRVRWDKPVEEADSVERCESLVSRYE
jgi:DNA ligase-1